MSALSSTPSRPPFLFLLLFIIAIFVASNSLHVEALSAPKILSSPLLFQPLPNLYILGTVHIGSESAEEAEALIEHVGPDTVIVEMASSRLERLQKRKQTSGQQASSESNKNATTMMSSNDSTPMTTTTEQQQQTSLSQAILSLPAFIDRGLSAGGLPGLLFALIILWPSLVKRSLTIDEEKDSLPRRDEFAAAIDATPEKTKIVAADWELDELIVKMATALSSSPTGWIQLAANSASIAVELRPADPIRRSHGESITDWAKRRRLPETSRKSKQHGETMSPQLHQVLVHERDDRFARLCLEEATGDENENKTVVCIVGLVHVDGIIERVLKEEQ